MPIPSSTYAIEKIRPFGTSSRYCEFLHNQVECKAWTALLNAASIQCSPSEQRDFLSKLNETVVHLQSALHNESFATFNRLNVAFSYLSLCRANLLQSIFSLGEIRIGNGAVEMMLNNVSNNLRATGYHELPQCLLTQALFSFTTSRHDAAIQYLDEAWDIAERGPMRLHRADIHLYRARLSFREKPYPWQSPHADLAAAEKLIDDCGYHRRDEELADAKRAVLGG